jgi:hypothetical protein
VSTHDNFDTVDTEKGVKCENCGEFEFELSYRGVAGTKNEREVRYAELPSECPVCDAELDHYSNSK